MLPIGSVGIVMTAHVLEGRREPPARPGMDLKVLYTGGGFHTVFAVGEQCLKLFGEGEFQGTEGGGTGTLRVRGMG
jgi:hypothetical protein